MGRSLISSTTTPLRISHIPRSFSLLNHPNQCVAHRFNGNSQYGYQRIQSFNTKQTRNLCTKAVLSDIPSQKQYPKVAAQSTGPIPPSQLIQVVESAAKSGAEVNLVSSLIYNLNSLFIFIKTYNLIGI